MIKKNLNFIKTRLSQGKKYYNFYFNKLLIINIIYFILDSSSFSLKLLKNIYNIDYKNLTWEDPLASGIISDNNSKILKEKEVYDHFMKPANKIIAKLSEPIKKQCHDFIINYKERQTGLLKQFSHNNQWKKDEEVLEKITDTILNNM